MRSISSISSAERYKRIYKVKGSGSRCGVLLDDLIILYTIEALSFDTAQEADAMRELARVKFWFMSWEVLSYEKFDT